MDTYAFGQIFHSLKNLTSCQLRCLDKARKQLQADSQIQLDKRIWKLNLLNTLSARTVNQKKFIAGVLP